jgi:hypothetical protein
MDAYPELTLGVQLDAFFKGRRKLRKALPTDGLCIMAVAVAQESIDSIVLNGKPLDALGMDQYHFWRAVETLGTTRNAEQLRRVLEAKGGVLGWKEGLALSYLRCAHRSTIGGHLAAKIASANYHGGFDKNLQGWHEAGKTLTHFSATDPTWQIVGPGLSWWIQEGQSGGSSITLQEMVQQLDNTLRPLTLT